MRDRKEECEDFCPCSVPTQKDKLGSACSACLASVSCFDIWWVILSYQMDAAVPGALLSAECCDPWCERRAKSSLLTLLYHGQQQLCSTLEVSLPKETPTIKSLILMHSPEDKRALELRQHLSLARLCVQTCASSSFTHLPGLQASLLIGSQPEQRCIQLAGRASNPLPAFHLLISKRQK